MARTSNASSKSVNATRARKRVEADTTSTTSTVLKRAKNGSAFTRCESCNKDVAVALISMHDCGLDAKIKMNLETLAVEMPEPVAKKPTEKKKTEPSVKKAGKKERDPTKPKRPPTAFFLFMDDFRKTFKEANPDNKKVAVVAKEGGEKWKAMTDEEKKVYHDKAAELKENYQKSVLENLNDAENETDKAAGESNEVEDDIEVSPPENEEVVAVADDE
uniref:high mobility group B protein 7 isoform X2 n=1 Tax=Erigeron canadensis TaxID=72917 RepID=UPI001CB976D4|nr:high mobility group B protein 7 isoform X2 [Erigeron canadensis]